MAYASRLLSGAIEKLLFHPMRVMEADAVGRHFRLIRLKGEAFQGLRWTPGQAVQFYLGKLTKRTYTPMNLDPDAGTARFLCFLHGDGPASTWAENLQRGDVCHVMRPKNSLDFTTFAAPALFFGDETSLAAAQALSCHRGPAAGDRLLLEVAPTGEAEAAAANLGLEGLELFPKTGTGSHREAVVQRLAALATGMGAPQWVFTGQAQSIQTVRMRLRALGVVTTGSMVKAYWSPGKTGMD